MNHFFSRIIRNTFVWLFLFLFSVVATVTATANDGQFVDGLSPTYFNKREQKRFLEDLIGKIRKYKEMENAINLFVPRDDKGQEIETSPRKTNQDLFELISRNVRPASKLEEEANIFDGKPKRSLFYSTENDGTENVIVYENFFANTDNDSYTQQFLLLREAFHHIYKGQGNKIATRHANFAYHLLMTADPSGKIALKRVTLAKSRLIYQLSRMNDDLLFDLLSNNLWQKKISKFEEKFSIEGAKNPITEALIQKTMMVGVDFVSEVNNALPFEKKVVSSPEEKGVTDSQLIANRNFLRKFGATSVLERNPRLFDPEVLDISKRMLTHFLMDVFEKEEDAAIFTNAIFMSRPVAGDFESILKREVAEDGRVYFSSCTAEEYYSTGNCQTPLGEANGYSIEILNSSEEHAEDSNDAYNNSILWGTIAVTVTITAFIAAGLGFVVFVAGGVMPVLMENIALSMLWGGLITGFASVPAGNYLVSSYAESHVLLEAESNNGKSVVYLALKDSDTLEKIKESLDEKVSVGNEGSSSAENFDRLLMR